MTKINIVLVEPEIPQNTGNIARTCSATGAALHLVEPMGFVIDDRKLKRAGLDYWNTLEIYMYPSLADFMEKHGEDISVESVVGEYTEFRFGLSLSAGKPKPKGGDLTDRESM